MITIGKNKVIKNATRQTSCLSTVVTRSSLTKTTISCTIFKHLHSTYQTDLRISDLMATATATNLSKRTFQ